MKWSFNPPGSGQIIDVERIQTKWDREQAAKIRVRVAFLDIKIILNAFIKSSE